MLEVKFTFFDHKNERTITRTVFAGHKGFENKATTKADVYKSALSKSYTVVARTFGIGSNLKEEKPGPKKLPPPPKKEAAQKLSDLEDAAYKAAEEAEYKPMPKPKKKSWNKKSSVDNPGPGF